MNWSRRKHAQIKGCASYLGWTEEICGCQMAGTIVTGTVIVLKKAFFVVVYDFWRGIDDESMQYWKV